MDLNSLVNAKNRKDAEENIDDVDNNVNKNEVEDVNEDKDKAEKDNEDEAERNNENKKNKQLDKTKNMMNINKFTMTFRDVEDSIKPFNGDEKYPVTQWIMNFEETIELFKQTDIQKMIFANNKRSLRGLAKLFIQEEKGLNTWKNLKKALQEEFSDKINK